MFRETVERLEELDLKEIISLILKTVNKNNNYSQIHRFYSENIYDFIYSHNIEKYIQQFKAVFDKNFYRMDVLKQKFIINLFFYVPFFKHNNNIHLFFETLYDIFTNAKIKNNFELMAYLFQPLLFSYFYHIDRTNNIVAQKEFNEKVVKIIERTIINNFKTKFKRSKKNKKEKIKIGFLIERAIWHSINQINYSFLKELKKILDDGDDNIEITILNLKFFDFGNDFLDIENKFRNIGFKYIDLHRLTNTPDTVFYSIIEKSIKMRGAIRKLNLDVLIASPISHFSHIFLFTSRVAKKQIYWSHGNCALDFKGIDIRMSHFEQSCNDFEWQIIEVGIDKDLLVGSKEEQNKGFFVKAELLKEYGENTIFLGTIGRLIKLESKEYLKIVSKIMKENSNTIYLACGAGNQNTVKQLMEKAGINLGRVFFTGEINAHIFGWVIDVWLDTFPIVQGKSRNEFEAKGGAIVGMKKYYPKSYIKSLKNLTNKKLLADNEEEYIELANKLIKDKNFRKEVGEIFKSRINLVNRFDINNFMKIIKEL